MSTSDSLGRTRMLVAIAVFVALVVDGMDLQMLALALPSISSDFKLDTVSAGALGTYTLAGMGVGGLLSGWLADRVGRVRVVRWSVLTFTAFTGVITWCDSYWQIAVMRFVSGFGIGALYTIGTLLAAEYVPTRVRTTVLGALQAGWAVGFVAAALLASYLLPRFGWRPLFACAFVPGVIALALLWRAPEPPSWVASRRNARALAATARPLAALLEDPAVLRTLLLWTVASIALQFGYYGANTWLPSYLVRDLGVSTQSMGWFVASTYSMTVVGKIVCGWLGDVFGRRVVWVGAGLLTAVYIPFLVYAATPSNVPWLLLLYGFLYAAPYAVNSTYLAESFPSGLRGTAVAVSYNLGRIGATASPLLIGFAASSYSIGAGIALLGVAYAACALVPGMFIREKMFDPNAIEPQTSSSAPDLAATPAVARA
jgi:AAHS family cis,cis-muconate transporter-like MFS transporter